MTDVAAMTTSLAGLFSEEDRPPQPVTVKALRGRLRRDFPGHAMWMMSMDGVLSEESFRTLRQAWDVCLRGQPAPRQLSARVTRLHDSVRIVEDLLRWTRDHDATLNIDLVSSDPEPAIGFLLAVSRAGEPSTVVQSDSLGGCVVALRGTGLGDAALTRRSLTFRLPRSGGGQSGVTVKGRDAVSILALSPREVWFVA